MAKFFSEQVDVYDGGAGGDLGREAVAVPVKVQGPKVALLDRDEALVAGQRQPAVLPRAVKGPREVSLGPLARPKLHLVGGGVHVDPIHDGRLVGDGGDEARV